MKSRRCLRCRNPLPDQQTGRRRRYCSDACRQAAYEQRKRQHVCASSKSDEWSTDPKVFAEIDREFGPFDLDPCATVENTRCARFFTKEDDGLSRPWIGRVYMNPPYGKPIPLWVSKAWESVESGDAELVVCLLPARVDTAWWHDWCVRGEVRFFKGRLTFGGAKNTATFPSALVVFRKENSLTKLMCKKEQR